PARLDSDERLGLVYGCGSGRPDHHGLRQLLHVVAPTAETSMGTCCADVRLDGVRIFHCRPSATPVEFDSARVAVRDKCRLQSAPRRTKKHVPDGFGVPLAAL